MIILDTNVVSEPMKPNPDRTVIAWLDRQEATSLYLTATSCAELLIGIAMMPPGKRRSSLSERLSQLLEELFGTRILPFDAAASRHYATLIMKGRAAGRTISVADGQIAAIAAVHNFSVATRDVGPFKAAGVPIIDPWVEG